MIAIANKWKQRKKKGGGGGEKVKEREIFFASIACALNMNDRFGISVMHSSIRETFR